jgi:hypothetical protein
MARKKNRQESLPNKQGVTFKVGDGVHWGWNGDRDPGTVVAISDSGRQVYVSSDEAEVLELGNIEGDRKCNFTSIKDPQYLACWTLRKDGRFTEYPGGTLSLQPERCFARNPHL